MKVDRNHAVIAAVIVSTLLKITKSYYTDCQFRFHNEIDERDGYILKAFNLGELDMVKFEINLDKFTRRYILINDSFETNPLSEQSDVVQYGLTNYFLVNNAGLIILGYPSNVEALSLWTLSKGIQTIQLNISLDTYCVSGIETMTSDILTLLKNDFAFIKGLISDKNHQICVFDLSASDRNYMEQTIFTFPYYTHDVYRKKCQKFECANTSCTDIFVDDSSLSDVILIAAILIPIIYPLFGFLFPIMLSNPGENPHLYFEKGECPFAPRRIFLHVAKFSMITGKILYLFIFLTWLSALIFCQYQLSKDNLPEGFLQFADSQLQWYMWRTEYWSTFGQFSYFCIPYLLCIISVRILKEIFGNEERALFYKKFLILSCRSDSSRADLEKCFPYIHFISVVDTPIADCSVSHYLWTYSAFLYNTRLFSLFSFRMWLVILKRSWHISANSKFFIKVFQCLLVSPIIFAFNCFSFVLQCTLVSNSVFGGKLFVLFMVADMFY
ncbi:uncharacterized protein LOC123543186 [Mercenaria mercenaria]|uniref:uncharacterized protein LOC123543186 n=1 Tax=Mercenaria mercenaria TaxID=6596 RepID=UPI00234F70D8|nr:uncharacterized protein LOC123543186 [Mercenaria mercenaria]XP_045185211.2 uncharacterized protein LOC123543186 [Mercenaria mercenaria]